MENKGMLDEVERPYCNEKKCKGHDKGWCMSMSPDEAEGCEKRVFGDQKSAEPPIAGAEEVQPNPAGTSVEIPANEDTRGVDEDGQPNPPTAEGCGVTTGGIL